MDERAAGACSNVDISNTNNSPRSESVPEIVLQNHSLNTTTFPLEENLGRLSVERELSGYYHESTMEIEQLHNDVDDQNNSSNPHLVHPFETHQDTIWDNSNELQQHSSQPGMLSLLHLPSTVLPHSSITLTNPMSLGGYFPGSFGYEALLENPARVGASSVMYDPMIHQNQLLLCPPHGYNWSGPSSGSLLFSNGGNEEEDGNRQIFVNEEMEISEETKQCGRGRGRGGNKGTKLTEREKRVKINRQYDSLRELVPNPTKIDKASVVGDAINYIQELRRTVNELKLMVENKRCGRERSKRQKTEQDTGAGNNAECNLNPLSDPKHEYSHNDESLRSSWVQRKSKDTEVDVRIIHYEVTIKLVQVNKINPLLYVSKVLDELQLDLHHAAGGHIGNSYSFLFNTKMHEGSCLYASAIANKLIEVLERQYANKVETKVGQ